MEHSPKLSTDAPPSPTYNQGPPPTLPRLTANPASSAPSSDSSTAFRKDVWSDPDHDFWKAQFNGLEEYKAILKEGRREAHIQPAIPIEWGRVEGSMDEEQHGWYGGMIESLGASIGVLGGIPFCMSPPDPYKPVSGGNVGLVTKYGRFARAVDPISEAFTPAAVIHYQIGETARELNIAEDNILLQLTDVNLNVIKQWSRSTYGSSVESDVKGDLAMKTNRLYDMHTSARRSSRSEHRIVQPGLADIANLYSPQATSDYGRNGDEVRFEPCLDLQEWKLKINTVLEWIQEQLYGEGLTQTTSEEHWKKYPSKLVIAAAALVKVSSVCALLSIFPGVGAMDADLEPGGAGFYGAVGQTGALVVGGGAAIALDRIRRGARHPNNNAHPQQWLLVISRMLASCMTALAGAYSLVAQDSSAPDWLLYTVYGVFFGATLAFLLVSWGLHQIAWPGCLIALLLTGLMLFALPSLYDSASQSGPLLATGCTFLVVYLRDIAHPVEELFWDLVRFFYNRRMPVENTRL